MAEEIKELIEKIQQEGVAAAQEKARQIEETAREHAQSIVDGAQKKAERLISEAKEQIGRTEDSSRALLKQAARDALLSLRNEIAAMLQRVVQADVAAALSEGERASIISAMIRDYCGRVSSGSVVVTVASSSGQKLEEAVMRQLQDEVKKKVEIRISEEMENGFLISFDSGKSQFDFSDKALAELMGRSLKPTLRMLLDSGK